MIDRLDAGLRRLVATNLIGILFVDLAGKILDVDESFPAHARLCTPGRICPRAFTISVPEDRRLDDEAFEKLMAFGVCAPFEKNLMRRDGSSFRCCSAPRFTTKRLRASSSISRRTSRRRQNHLAYHDALDLPNQVLFKDRLKQAIAMSRRNDQMQAVLLLNLDRFKTINDSLGYTADAIDYCSLSRNG